MFFSAHHSRRFSGERGKGFVFLEATHNGACDVFAKHLTIAQAVGGESDGVVASEQGGNFRSPIPAAQLIERHLIPIIFLGQFGDRREHHWHDEGRFDLFHQLRSSPFLAGGDEDGVEAQLRGERLRAV